MRIFITGGTGFIGKSLVPLLTSLGHQVLVLTREKSAGAEQDFPVVIGDLHETRTYRDTVESFAPDCAIHLGWQGLPDYSFGNCRLNLTAGLDLLEILREIGCSKVVALGTCWEYGRLSGPVCEANSGVDLNLFATFKLALKEIGSGYFNDSGAKFIWVRPFFIYGPDQRASALIPTVFRSLQFNQSASVQNPEAVNDFIHVHDVVSAITILVESPHANGVYNLGCGKPHAVWEVVNYVAKTLGLEEVYNDMPVQFENAFWANIQKMSDLGWAPSLSLEQGISQTAQSWESRP
jgi:nucleoside-diphosphate-sugar epimerase